MNPALDRRQFAAGTDEFLRGHELLGLARTLGDTALFLQFSCGKDSVAMWLWLREAAPDLRIIPYWLYLVPGLGYQERTLAYYEEFFGQHIIRLPHPLLYSLLARAVWQPPDSLAVLNAMRLQEFTYAEQEDLLAADLELTAPFCAIGMRSKDNLERMRMIDQMGVIGLSGPRRFLYPIWDWSVDDVAAIIVRSGAKLSAEYAMFGRTITALTYRRLEEIARRYPEDYATIREWFPLIDAERFRYERVGAARQTVAGLEVPA